MCFIPSAHKPNSRCHSLGDADTHAPQIGQFPTGEGSLSAFSFAYTGAKEKAIKKKTPKEDFALCGARPPTLAARASL